MKVHSLYLKNFRIFRGKHLFNLHEKKFIIIHGSNGHGKSTFFDAITWVLTGKFPRYQGSNEARNFNYIINHNEYLLENSKTEVEIDFLHEDRYISIKRQLRAGGSEKVFIDNEEYGKKAGDKKIKSILSLDLMDEESNIDLANLFSSTQLLLQDTLQDFVKSDRPVDRFKKMETILGLRKYGEDFKKYLNDEKKRLVEESIPLQDTLNTLENDIKVLNTKIEERKSMYNKLGNITEDDIIFQLNIHLANLNGYELAGLKHLPKYKTSIDSRIREDLTDFLKEVKGEIEQLENKQNILKQIEDNLITDDEYLSNTKKFVKERGRVVGIISRRKNGIHLCDIKDSKLSEIQSLRKEIQNINKEIKELLEQVEINDNFLKSIMDHNIMQDIKQNYNNASDFLKEYKYNVDKKEIFNIALSIRSNLQEIEVTEKEFKKIESEIKNYRIEEKVNESKISTLNEELNVFKKDYDEKKSKQNAQIIYKIQDFILNNEETKECLVCGFPSDKKRGVLEKAIKEQIELSNQRINSKEKKIRELVNQIEKFNDIQREIKRKVMESLLENKEMQKRLDNLKLDNEKLALDIRGMEFINENSANLKLKSEENEHFLKKYRLAFDLLQEYIIKKSENDDYQKEIKIKQNDIKDLKTSHSSRWSKYFNIEDYEFEKKYLQLKHYKLKAIESIKKFENELTLIDYELQNYHTRWTNQLNNIKLLSDKDSNFELTISFINMYRQKITDKVSKLYFLEKEFDLSVLQITKFLDKNGFEELTSEQILKNRNIEDLKIKILNNHQLQNVINEFLQNHQKIHSELIGEYLLKHSENINKFFRQLSPHAIYKYVQLLTKDNELYMLLGEEKIDYTSEKLENILKLPKEKIKEKVNASLSFSAAQSTILALCVFLSLNLSQNWTKLNLIGIDDPFQNLDDINIYSFVDLIKEVILKENKQVILSTHSEEFSKLLQSKVRLETKQTLLINIISYNKDKVDIECGAGEYQFLGN